MTKKILLSFDVEEFDIPEEYGQRIPEKIKLETSLKGLEKILIILKKLNIKATFFVTAYFARSNKEIIREISKKHEIASHGFSHSSFSLKDLKRSKSELEKITKNKIKGLRIPKLKKINDKIISEEGYEYNSSLNPTYLPGRYNNFFKKRTPYWSGNLLNIPLSVTPIIRFPLFWLSFKNFPLSLIKKASKLTLVTDKYLSIYFHPWEFTDISSFKLPNYIKRKSGKEMYEKLEKYLIWLKTQGEFISYIEFKDSFPKTSY